MKAASLLAASILTSAIYSAASASVIEVDLASVAFQAYTPLNAPAAFDTSFRDGHLALSLGTAYLSDMKVDGTQMDFNYDADVAALSGNLTLASGTVTGGSLTVTLSDQSQYLLTVGPGEMLNVNGKPALFSSASTSTFTTSAFAGVDVGPLAGNPQPASLRLTQHLGSSTLVDLQMISPVPEPSMLSVCGAAAVGLLGRRVRRGKETTRREKGMA